MSTNEHHRHQRVAIERADALFGRRTINEIRAIEKATKNQIQDKNTQLRQLVGESYKDVILSSDAILNMKSQSQRVQAKLDQIGHTLTPDTFIRQDSILSKKERQLELELQLIGSRVKYLVDSQEVIWSALDSKDFLEASRRLIRAQIVHEMLQGDEMVSKRFPFLYHCWNATEELRNPILDRVRQEMITGSNPDSRSEAISCLCAIASLERQSSIELVSAFLQFRKLSIVNVSSSFSSASQTVESLTRIGRLVQDTLTQSLELFLPTSPLQGSSHCPIQLAAKEDGIGFSGLLFTSETSKSEEELWSVQLESIYKNLGPLDSPILVTKLQDWFHEVSTVVQQAGNGLLLSCTSLKSLKTLEGEVKDALKRDESWTEFIEGNLGTGFEIWKGLFESVIQNKSLELVEAAFVHTCGTLVANLDSKIEHLASMTLEPLGEVSTNHWSISCGVNEELVSKFASLDVNLSHNLASNLRSYPLEIVRSFDQELGVVLEQILELLGGKGETLDDGNDSPKSALSTHQGGSVRSFSLISGSRSVYPISHRTFRSRELEPKIQTLWEKSAFHLASELQEKLNQFPVPIPLQGGVQVLEAVLLVSEISLGIAENCQTLTVLSGPSEEWRTEFHSQSIHGSVIAPSSARFRQKDIDHSTRTLANAFRSVAFSGITQWTQWTVTCLGVNWKQAIGPDMITGMEHQEEVRISHQLEAEFENQEEQMKFMIPAAPSEATVEVLRSAAIELQRLEQEFRIQLKLLLDTLSSMENPEQKLDAYVLQLLMDFRFLRDLCSTGQPVPDFQVDHLKSDQQTIRSLLSVPEDAISLHDQTQKQDPEIKRAVMESRHQSKKLEQDLSALLDPIDWATYEPHLWTAEARFYRRTSVLFGSLIQSSKELHANVNIKPPTGVDNNTLNAAEVIPRLPYLPVRSFAPEFSKSVRIGVSQTEKLIQFEALDLEEDEQGHFSFADLGMSSTSTTNPAEDSSEKMQTGSLTALGTMFTDKAAEMSALAQQRFEQFGDYLQPTGTSIFSTFTKGVSRTNQ
eukprot:g6403.t1